jgi:transposase InsO family protein
VIDAEKANYKIAWMCRLLRVPRSSFYAWRNRAETATAARRRELAVHVRRVFDQGRGAYGCRRVAAELGLRACQPRAYKRTTVPGEQPVTSPDLIGRDFTAKAPGQRLVGDITYLRTGEGWLYLATVIDLATRMVTGWQLADHMRTSLVADALDMAITHGHAQPGAVFHSDKGTQYTSAEFARYCQANGIRTSTGRTGVCWDNAAAESFFGALKNEMYHASPTPPGPPPGSPSLSTSRCSTTGNGCTQPWATAPRPRPWPATRPQQPLHDQQTEELSKIVDTPQLPTV